MSVGASSKRVANLKRVALLLVIAALGTGAAVVPWLAQAKGPAAMAKAPVPAPKAVPAPSPSGAHCKADGDCVVVPDGCCGCGEGGSQRAIAKKDRDAHEKERTRRCAGTMCAQMMSQHPSCAQRPVCRASACTLAP